MSKKTFTPPPQKKSFSCFKKSSHELSKNYTLFTVGADAGQLFYVYLLLAELTQASTF